MSLSRPWGARAALVVGAALTCLLLVACGNNRNEPENSAIADGGGGSGWCKSTTIRFFNGGDPGDTFARIVRNGAERAAKDTGAKLDIVYSGWDPSKMVDQLRQAIEDHPDGISMMGHPGDAAIMPLAEKAWNEGILMEYANVDVPKVRARYGGGFVGADLARQGAELASRSIADFDLKVGDKAIVFGQFGDPARAIRENAAADTLQEAGLEVRKIVADVKTTTDPNLLTPTFSSAVKRQNGTKIVVMPGGPLVGAAPQYLKGAGLDPGEVKIVGFDLTPTVLEAFNQNAAQLIADQQPFLQGYLPIVSLCSQKMLRVAPISVDTSAGFVTPNDVEPVSELVKQGLR
jgi:simple sugar transport system substrate-binding protein